MCHCRVIGGCKEPRHVRNRRGRPDPNRGLLPGGVYIDVKSQSDVTALRALGVQVWRL